MSTTREQKKVKAFAERSLPDLLYLLSVPTKATETLPKDVVVLRSSLTQLMGDYLNLLALKNSLAFDLEEQAKSYIAQQDALNARIAELEAQCLSLTKDLAATVAKPPKSVREIMAAEAAAGISRP